MTETGKQEILAILDEVIDGVRREGMSALSFTRCLSCRRITHASDATDCPNHGRKELAK